MKTTPRRQTTSLSGQRAAIRKGKKFLFWLFLKASGMTLLLELGESSDKLTQTHHHHVMFKCLSTNVKTQFLQQNSSVTEILKNSTKQIGAT